MIVSVEEYERSEHERELRVLVQGDKEIAAGKGHDLEEVFRDADRILAK